MGRPEQRATGQSEADRPHQVSQARPGSSDCRVLARVLTQTS